MTDLERTLAALAVRPWQLVRCWPHSKKPAAPAGAPWPVSRDVTQLRHHVLVDHGNLGLVAGAASGVVILDPDNLEAWAALVARLGEPGPRWVETGSGKAHYHVRWEPDLPAKLISVDGEIVGEVQRGPGEQHALIPPSVHPRTGKRYRWLVDPITTPLAPLPGPWRAWLGRARSPARPSAPTTTVAADRLEALRVTALRQPGAQRRTSGAVKFRCPMCTREGYDYKGDNAVLFPNGRWGCAWAAGTALGRMHWDAIGEALGVFARGR